MCDEAQNWFYFQVVLEEWKMVWACCEVEIHVEWEEF